eukprot:scaffold3832_cov69-Phaeocystis_antarctica.AAC.2
MHQSSSGRPYRSPDLARSGGSTAHGWPTRPSPGCGTLAPLPRRTAAAYALSTRLLGASRRQATHTSAGVRAQSPCARTRHGQASRPPRRHPTPPQGRGTRRGSRCPCRHRTRLPPRAPGSAPALLPGPIAPLQHRLAAAQAPCERACPRRRPRAAR